MNIRYYTISLLLLFFSYNTHSMSFPDKTKTPGKFDNGTKVQFACLAHYTEGKDYKGDNVRKVTQKIRNSDYDSYGVPKENRKLYTIDHYIPLGILGTNDPENLWPQPRDEAKQKDAIENKLRKMVCSGQMSLRDAQNQLLNNPWLDVYNKFITK